MPQRFNRLIEPFSGMASISIATAFTNKSKNFFINDINKPLILLLKEAIEYPDRLIQAYENIWKDQFTFSKNHTDHFYFIREKFNDGDIAPEIMLYLLARCVKGSVRYGKNGKFNQSPDNRRHGTHPKNMSQNIFSISSLLKGKTYFSYVNYKEIFSMAQRGDVVYLDPPYQGVCSNKDSRYFSPIDFDEFCNTLDELNNNNIDFILSYDGVCGDKSYGKELPPYLECKKFFLNAGISSQQTLLGNKMTTYESLYISKNLCREIINSNIQLSLI